MCGILAIIGIYENDIREWKFKTQELIKLIRHRGPDFSGIHCFKNCILAHERLAIIGIETGNQPILDKNKKIGLTINGEIYNYKILKSLLNENLIIKSDCEIILHLYIKYGIDFLKTNYINGMYAFVLYDSINDIYIAARDPIGIIPLYIGYSKDGNIFISSEIKVIQKYCTYIEIFPPGYYFTCDSKCKVSFNRFYETSWFRGEINFPIIALHQYEIRTKLIDSVNRHMMSEVPFGLLLSGGLDSSLIASIACKKYKTLFPDKKLKSFCIGLKNSPDINHAESVANFIGSEHFSFNFTIQEGIDAIKDVIYYLETFDLTTVRASIPMYLLARKINTIGCKMVLSGEGADELFGGYLYFKKAPNETEFHKEIIRKVTNLHKYDCLRANKSMMAWGIETRVPFLDREFMEFAISIDPVSKMQNNNNIEKFILRQAFNDLNNPFLPSDILWRQKEQFSDGVGYDWINSLKQYANINVTDRQMELAIKIYPNNTPTTKEEFLYRTFFNEFYPSDSATATVPEQGKSIACSSPEALKWDDSFKLIDPSGRVIKEHNKSIN